MPTETPVVVDRFPRTDTGDGSAGASASVRPWALWCLVLAPVTIVLHESAHLITAYAVGFPSPTLHFSSVDPGPSLGLPPSAMGLVALAGPMVSAVMALLGCALMARVGPLPWAAALAVCAASRFVVSVPYTLGSLVVRALGKQLAPPVFDEYQAGTALGVSGDGLLAISALILAGVIWWVGRHLPRGATRIAWTGLLGGTAAGWAVWMLGLGPLLLP
jgi:hypothetical protein